MALRLRRAARSHAGTTRPDLDADDDPDVLERRTVLSLSAAISILGALATTIYPFLLGFSAIDFAIDATGTCIAIAAFILGYKDKRSAAIPTLVWGVFVAIAALLVRTQTDADFDRMFPAVAIPVILAFAFGRTRLGGLFSLAALTYLMLDAFQDQDVAGDVTTAFIFTGLVAAAGLAPAMKARVARRVSQAEMEAKAHADSNLMKTRFLSVAGHELSHPLTPIRLHLRLIRSRRGAALSPDDEKSLAVIERSVDRFALLISDLLDVARLDSGRMNLSIGEVDVGDILAGEVETASTQAVKQNVAISVKSEPGCTGIGDAQRIAQVLANLLSNAIKFSPEGGQVRASCQQEGSEVRVEIADEGIGLPSEAITSLFQPFVRIDRPDVGPIPGTGLGLHICKGLIEAQGGRIGAVSPGVNQGTTFWFTIPRAPTNG